MQIFNVYHPCMWVRNVFSHVCVFVCLFVQATTFEPLNIEISFLVYRYTFSISRSHLNIKVIRSRSRSYEKNDNFAYFNMSIPCIWLQAINKVKITYQSEGHIKVKVKISTSFQFYVLISTH